MLYIYVCLNKQLNDYSSYQVTRFVQHVFDMEKIVILIVIIE